MAFREAALDMAKVNPELSDLDIYEFGIWQGASAISIANILESHNVRCNMMYGFDSFEGLPSYDADAWLPNERDSDLWDEKLFDLTTSGQSVQDVIDRIQTKLEFSPTPMKFIPGYYETSLKDELVSRHEMKPAVYIDIDVDLYKSTILALDFLFRNNLIQVGTLIGYHDWGGLKEFTGGESLAHKELMKKFHVTCEEVFTKGRQPNIQKIFRVDKVC